MTLRLAFAGRDRQAAETDHARRSYPAATAAAAPRDLETIILKAMAKEVAARYARASDLADDLRRFLEGRPILARPASALDRAGKWARRHRAAVAAVAVALLLSLSASTALLWVAKKRTDTALALQHEARLEQFIALERSLGMVDLIVRRTVDKSPGSETVDAENLEQLNDTVILFYEELAKRFSRDEMMQEVVAKALRGAGRQRMTHGRPNGRFDFREAIRRYEEMTARHPSRIWLRAGLIETLEEYARLLKAPEDAAEAHAACDRALATAEKLINDAEAESRFSTGCCPDQRSRLGLVKRSPARVGDAPGGLARNPHSAGPVRPWAASPWHLSAGTRRPQCRRRKP